MEAKSNVWKLMYGFANSMTLKCALQLGLPDLIHKHGEPMTLTQLVNSIPVASPDPDYLFRIMRFLVQNNLFTCSEDEKSGELKYGLTPESELLVMNHDKSLAKFVLQGIHLNQMSAWQHLMDGLGCDTYPWMVCHKLTWHESAVKDVECLQLYIDAMKSYTTHVVEPLVSGCIGECVFDNVNTIVDIGGNTGITAKAVVDAFPDVKVTVMDLQEVIDQPHIDHPRIEYLAGDAFSFIPKADVIFMKSFLHGYSEEQCIEVLKKCKEAIPLKTGKVVLVEIAVDAEGFPEFDMPKLCMDMEMLIAGGKERNKKDWANMLTKAGFTQHKIIPIAALESIIEARP